MWTILERKRSEKLLQLPAESYEKLQAAVGVHELSQDEINEITSPNMSNHLNERVIVDTLPVVKSLASLRYVLDRIERGYTANKF